MSPTKSPKVFLGSSVVIAAAISSTGAARTLILRGLRGEETLVFSPLVLEETRRNLARKAPNALDAFDLFHAALPHEMVAPSSQRVLESMDLVDPKDAPIIAAAWQAQAGWIVSYDKKHLLNERARIFQRFGIRAGTPEEYLSEHA